jgi:ABC-type sugar transport system permease subunit
MYRWFPSILKVVTIVQPETLVRWERIGCCIRMLRFFVRFNRPESFIHTRSSAGFTIITSGFEFSVHVVFTNVWRGIPFFAIMLLAGLQSVPDELYEAAHVDGAGVLARFWQITLPLLRPIIVVATATRIIWTFKGTSKNSGLPEFVRV